MIEHHPNQIDAASADYLAKCDEGLRAFNRQRGTDRAKLQAAAPLRSTAMQEDPATLALFAPMLEPKLL